MEKIADKRQNLPQTPSIDPEEVGKFSAMAAEWWDPKGKFKPLHKFNPVRLGFIRDTACLHFGLNERARKPLEGLRILDIGCGGGLVSEPMARLGAQVTGVDASEENIKTAMTHAEEAGVKVDYRAGTAEGLIEEGVGPFDLVLNLEVVEHVADPAGFLKNTAGLVRPGGLMIASTLNRTPKAFALAIVGAEYVLRWLPPGTHDFSKFLAPEQVIGPMEDAGLETERPQGVSFNPISDQWRLSSDTKVNYMVVGKRPAEVD